MVRRECPVVDPRVETRREAARTIVSRKPRQHRRRQRAELMPARAAAGFDQEVFKTVIRLVDLGLPEVQRGLRNLEGKVGLPEVEHGLPKEPLM